MLWRNYILVQSEQHHSTDFSCHTCLPFKSDWGIYCLSTNGLFYLPTCLQDVFSGNACLPLKSDGCTIGREGGGLETCDRRSIGGVLVTRVATLSFNSTFTLSVSTRQESCWEESATLETWLLLVLLQRVWGLLELLTFVNICTFSKCDDYHVRQGFMPFCTTYHVNFLGVEICIPLYTLIMHFKRSSFYSQNGPGAWPQMCHVWSCKWKDVIVMGFQIKCKLEICSSQFKPEE